MMTAPHLGAYASIPRDHRADTRRNLAHLQAAADRTGCSGFEVPWASSSFVPDAGALSALLEKDGTHVLTMIAATMEARTHPGFGLASLDTSGRRAAIELVRSAQQATIAMSDRASRSVVNAVEVHSAASVDLDRADEHAEAFAVSLAEIADWDWRGAQILVEHCDSARGIHPVKGFLDLDAELWAIEQNIGRGTPLSIAINWGRSALETRRTSTPAQHARAAAAAGRLGALAFSGVSDQMSPLGEAWGDSHIAAQGPVASRAGLSSSLLGPAEIRDFFEVGVAPITIVKVGAPTGVSVDPIDVVAESFALVAAALQNRC